MHLNQMCLVFLKIHLFVYIVACFICGVTVCVALSTQGAHERTYETGTAPLDF